MDRLEHQKKEGRDIARPHNAPRSSLNSLERLFAELKVQLNLDDDQLIEILKSGKNSALCIPLSVFSSRPLGILESLSVHLHENMHLTFSEISLILNRDPRTIWTSYTKARKKLPDKLNADYSSIQIPIHVFQNRRYGTLESLARYLKDEKGMKFHSIAKALNRDDRTIWTSYSRAMKK